MIIIIAQNRVLTHTQYHYTLCVTLTAPDNVRYTILILLIFLLSYARRRSLFAPRSYYRTKRYNDDIVTSRGGDRLGSVGQ